MGKIMLERGDFGNYQILGEEESHVMLIQSEMDFPGIASTFGWIPCECGETDGTVDCKHRKVADMICEAIEYLDNHIQMMVDDPGYFE